MNVNDRDTSAIAADSEGNIIYKEEIISYLNREYDRRHNEKQSLQLQWELNSNFIAGNQYCDINTTTKTVEQLKKENDWTQKEVYNHMAPIYETRIAKLGNIKPSMTVRPAGNELDDVAKADVSTSILKGIQIKSNFPGKLSTANAWCEICGTVCFMSWWNAGLGTSIINDDTNKIFSGDLDYGIITAFEIFPDSIFNQEISDCSSILVRQVKSVDEIYNLYGVKLEGKTLPTFSLATAATGGFGYEAATMSISSSMRENCENVTTYFEVPGRKFPKGRMIIMLGDDNLIFYGDLPYSNNDRFIPIVKMCSSKRPGHFFGGSVHERLIPVQRAYNALKNRKHDYLNRVAYGTYQVDADSVDTEALEENGIAPGSVIPRIPGSRGLEELTTPNLPATFENEETRLQREFEYLSGISEMSIISQAPSGVTSGVALNAITESDNTRLSTTAENMRNAVKELAAQWLKIYKSCAAVPRVLQYCGTNNISNVIVFSREDITSFDIVFDTENELIDTLERRRNTILELLRTGLLADENGVINARVKRKLFEGLKVGNWEDAMDIENLHIGRARYENINIESGVIPEIKEYDDHEIHIDEHNRMRLQSRYELFKSKYPKLAETFDEHIKLHEQYIVKKQQQLMMMAQGGA